MSSAERGADLRLLVPSVAAGGRRPRNRAAEAAGRRGWAVSLGPRLGQLVYSRAGRDRHRPLVVVGTCDARHVLCSDGRLRPGARPKRKNVRHLALGHQVHPGVAAGQRPDDGELWRWIRSVTAGLTAAAGTGFEEGNV